jgi:hypothetical protein
VEPGRVKILDGAIGGPPSGIAELRPALSEAATDDNGSTIDDPYQLLNTSCIHLVPVSRELQRSTDSFLEGEKDC